MIKVIKNRFYLNKISGLHLKRLNITSLEVNNCDFYQNDSFNIFFSKVKTKDPDSVNITQCRLAESETGMFAKDCMSFTILDVEFVKNKKCGFVILDSGNQKMSIRNSNQNI
jgi:hypothetical protein